MWIWDVIGIAGFALITLGLGLYDGRAALVCVGATAAAIAIRKSVAKDK